MFPSGADIVMYGLNLTHQVQTNDALVADLRASGAPLARFASQVFDFLHGVSPTDGPRAPAPEPDRRREFARTYASPQRSARQANQRQSRRRS